MPCAGRRGRLLRKILCIPILFTIAPPGQCEFSSSRAGLGTSSTDELDYDVHVPLAAVPLGVNVGHSLKVVSFRKNSKTGELPWIARRGWLAVGDTLVSLEGEDILEFSPSDFADAIQRVVESKRAHAKPPGVGPVLHDAIHSGGEKATGFITLRVRPGEQPGRATRMNSMYSPPSQDEADEELARWHLRYSTGPTSLAVLNVTVSAFGGEPDSCDARPVVAASPEDGCSPLYNDPQVTGAHVLVRRGGCSFLAKALNIRNSGGGSVVVIDEGAGKLRMEAEQGEKVDIPVVMVSKFNGDILRKAAGSTSRATGKLTGTLIITPSCLPRKPPAENRIAFQRRPSSGGDGPSIQASQGSIGNSSGARRSMVADTGNDIGKENADALSTTARDELQRMGNTSHGGNKTVGTAANERGGENSVSLCRGRSAGPLRGGDLILESKHGARQTAEFLSTLVTGSLTVDGSDGIPVAHERGSGNDGAFVVDILSVCDSTAPEVSALRATQRGVILLLPPDPRCEVARQVHLGGGLGAAVLVVVAGAAPTGVRTTAVTLLATSIDPPAPPNTELLSPVGRGSHDVDDEGKYVQGWELTKRVGENAEVISGFSERRTTHSSSGLSADRESDRKPDDEICSPLTVVVGHEEGTAMLEWIRQARGAGGRDDTVTARLVEREGVGRLWADVVWASDPSNWPTGSTQRRRIINRLRKTHSPEHAGRGGGAHTASATRWLLLQEAYAALDVQSGPTRSEARQDAQPTSSHTSRDSEL